MMRLTTIAVNVILAMLAPDIMATITLVGGKVWIKKPQSR